MHKHNLFITRNLHVLIFIVASIALAITSIHYAIKINIYHGELDIYLPHYLGNTSILKTIFDPLCEYDLTRTTFRGREIGNFFNLIDTKLLSHLFRLRIPAFISVVHYISLFVMIVVVSLISQIIYKKRAVLTGLLLLLLLSATPIVLGGSFYRANKIIAATGVVIFIFTLELLKNSPKTTSRRILLPLIFSSSLIASLSDEQGFALVVIVSIWETLEFTITKKFTKLKPALFFLFASILFTIYYKEFIGAEIFEKIIGAKVTTENINFINIFFNLDNIIKSFSLLIKYISYLFGNLNIVVTSFFCLIIITRLYLKNSLGNFLYIAYILLTLTVVIHIMTLKHPAILWPDVITYYSLPIVCFIFSLTFIGLQKNINLFINGKWLYYFLISLIILNSISWNRNFDQIINGHISKFRVADEIISAVYGSQEQTRKILDKISLNNATPGYNPKIKYGENGISSLKSSLERKMKD